MTASMARYIAVRLLAPVLFTSACTPEVLEWAQDSSELVGALDTTVIRGSIVEGTGCHTAGAPIVNGNAVTFILQDYVAQRSGRGQERATCHLAVDVSLPPGIGIALDNVVYHGFADGSNARTTFSRDYQFASQVREHKRATVQEYDTDGNVTLVQDDSDQYTTEFGEFTVSDELLNIGRPVCGRNATWRAKTGLTARNFDATSFSLASIDTVDIGNRFSATFEFVAQSCR